MTVASKTLDTSLPWNSVAPGGVHVISPELETTLWYYSSDRTNNFNMLSSYAVFARADANDTYTVSSAAGNLNGTGVPWNAAWQAYHPDGQIIVIDTDSHSNWEFYNTTVNTGAKTITAGRAEYYNADTQALLHPASRGVGIPYLHMLILEQEILNGVIPHALSMRVKTPNSYMAWYPARKLETGGGPTLPNGLPEGARFTCSYTQAAIDTWATALNVSGGADLEAFGRMTAAAFTNYGCYITDNAGNGNGVDMQHISSMNTAPLRLVNATLIQNMLDNLFTTMTFTFLPETGPRILGAVPVPESRIKSYIPANRRHRR